MLLGKLSSAPVLVLALLVLLLVLALLLLLLVLVLALALAMTATCCSASHWLIESDAKGPVLSSSGTVTPAAAQ
jgi:hypothetical protein